jgi:hypothetical protein
MRSRHAFACRNIRRVFACCKSPFHGTFQLKECTPSDPACDDYRRTFLSREDAATYAQRLQEPSYAQQVTELHPSWYAL